MADYPFVKFHFNVEWGGTNIGFAEVSGLKVSSEVIDYIDGANPEYTSLKMPGRTSYEKVTFKRGTFKSDNEFYTWWNTIKLNTVERRDITISLLDETHSPVVVWRLKNAWPTSVASTDLNAKNSEVAIETLEVVHEGFSVETI